MTRQALLLLGSLFSFTTACTFSGPENVEIPFGSAFQAAPEGTVARNAKEAFPQAPENVPVLSPQDIFSACTRFMECQLQLPEDKSLATSKSDAVSLHSYCTLALEFSAERAIPVSFLTVFRFEYTADKWVECIQKAKTCEELEVCNRPREDIYCEEAGCRLSGQWKETRCEGSMATIVTQEKTLVRDCANVHGTCDPQSPTGCTDRPFTVCPDDLDKADRCEGNIRLGCDGSNQVSYRDCTRLGGVCGKTPQGTFDCIYPKPEKSSCPGGNEAYCSDGKLSACILYTSVEQATPLCSE
jgi:hypothetical protein